MLAVGATPGHIVGVAAMNLSGFFFGRFYTTRNERDERMPARASYIGALVLVQPAIGEPDERACTSAIDSASQQTNIV